ncbi:DUF2909 domain-containing protein [Vibrio sp. JPW-9-11-11]|uniref:DUF2909 family protein n=1 Tax=Vibrio sp. JPW-9-11-11 TaxID=1416532 RepID=UPI001593146E|nr:DUF2909 family protein [Vibrio sp. JPW-9-11-11]NVD08515.1 DUF2909 domain-containing protein [Vibrio sp. JPW-9-11-11]
MVFIFKLLLLLLLLFILINLGRAMFEMVRGDDEQHDASPDDKPMSFYLGRRVFLSALAIILLVAALLSGLIEPNNRPF